MEQVNRGDCAAILCAAGSGRRLQSLTGPVNKILFPFGPNEESCLSLCLKLLSAVSEIGRLIVVGREADFPDIERCISADAKGLPDIKLVAGGDERQESVRIGLREIGEEYPFTLVHDAARPFCPVDKVKETIDAARKTGAAILAVPVTDTVKRAGRDQASIDSTLDRSRLWLAQTPQVFSTSMLSDAHSQAEKEYLKVTDDSQLFELRGHPVSIVEGTRENLKLTMVEDLHFARLVFDFNSKAVKR